MPELLIIAGVAWLAGLAAFLGGVIGRFERSADSEIKREVTHAVVAFGGGLLLAAVAFGLMPEALDTLDGLSLVVSFCLGGAVASLLEAQITQRSGDKGHMMAMMMNFVPEVISLGAVFGHSTQLGIMLAAFIGAQNLPEGFNSYRQVVATGTRPRITLGALFAVSILGAVAAALGYLLLQERQELTALVMSFGAGGILYLIFQDIAPASTMRNHWTPPLGAVVGFAAGMLAYQFMH